MSLFIMVGLFSTACPFFALEEEGLWCCLSVLWDVTRNRMWWHVYLFICLYVWVLRNLNLHADMLTLFSPQPWIKILLPSILSFLQLLDQALKLQWEDTGKWTPQALTQFEMGIQPLTWMKILINLTSLLFYHWVGPLAGDIGTGLGIKRTKCKIDSVVNAGPLAHFSFTGSVTPLFAKWRVRHHPLQAAIFPEFCHA